MSRIKRLIRPDAQALNWKAAIPVLGLAAACIAGCAQLPTAEKEPAPIIPAVANFASCAKPHYPTESLRYEHTGTVMLNFKISADGKVDDSNIKKSSGYPCWARPPAKRVPSASSRRPRKAASQCRHGCICSTSGR